MSLTTQSLSRVPNALHPVLGNAHGSVLPIGFHLSSISHISRKGSRWRTRSEFRSESFSGQHCRYSEPRAYPWRWRAAHQRPRRQQMYRRKTPHRVRYLRSARRKSPTSAWGLSTSSTRKTPPKRCSPAYSLPGAAAEVAAAEAAGAEAAGLAEAAAAEAAAAAAADVACRGELAAGVKIQRIPMTLPRFHHHGRV